VAVGAGGSYVAACAQSPEVHDFHHTAWTSENGLGAVFDIQQATDGYLWLTTSTGVFRFDGVQFQSVEEATNGVVQNLEIHSAFPSMFGGVWLKTRAAGLLFWKDGKLTTFADRRCTPARQEGLAEGQDGSLWLQAAGGLFHMRGKLCEQVGAEQGYPGGFAAAILVDHKGTVWVRTLAGQLLYLERGRQKFQLFPYAAGSTSAAFVLITTNSSDFLHEAPDGTIWLSDDYGLRRVTDTSGSPVGPASAKPSKARTRYGDFTFTADHSLWAVTENGVRRFDRIERWQTPLAMESAPGESFTAKQGLSSSATWKVIVDREGSVWVGTNSGLDKLRRTALSTLELPQTVEHDFSLLAGDRGSVWTGNQSLPLIHVTDQGNTISFPGVRGTICLRRDRNGAIWSAGGGDSRIWRLSGKDVSPLSYPEEKLGPAISLAFDRNNDLWVSSATGGTYHLHGGVWSSENRALGKRPGIVGAMANDDSGDVWIGYSNMLAKWDGTTYRKFSFPDGTRGVSESTLSVRGDHVWLGGTGGVELFTKGQFRILKWKDRALPGRVSGVIETETGNLWTNGPSGITHVSAGELSNWLRDPAYEVSAERLDVLDGLPGLSSERIPEPSVVESQEGRLWFATNKGVAWLDPGEMDRNHNRLSPPVMISSIVSNGKTYAASDGLDLPAHTDRLQINFTALSFAVPERVLFRYKLDGVDTDWQDAGTRREVFYNSLSPGHYRFHVIACNNDGVWNMAGAATDLAIAPAFYQTVWFRSLYFAVAAGLLWLFYLFRLKQATAQIQERLDARLEERERIARDLHDTLLQGFQGLMLRFQAVLKILPEQGPARRMMEQVMDRADQVLLEGRQSVRDLRDEGASTGELLNALASCGKELAQDETLFSLAVVGTPELLDPVVFNEVYRIAREALVNAFLHAQAAKVEVELTYGRARVSVRVRDDGVGIDRRILDGGKKGHWGLSGMRERAQKIGAQLKIWSNTGVGTEIELTVPARIAYPHKRKASLWMRIRGAARSKAA
jgi:signal transduction histidine kinase/ligand-binding sensor domain-containing protein